MYHELTYRDVRKRRLRRIVCALLVVVIVACLVFAMLLSRNVARDQSAYTVRDSVIQAAVQCCAVEGSYPSSLSHLEEKYGLVINKDDYVVNYEWLGDNVPPSVVVRPR